MSGDEPITRPLLTTPRAAAMAGIVFSLLLTLVFVLIRLSIPPDLAQSTGWLSDPAKRTDVTVAINLVPFAGIAFLWFIGVIRDRIGVHEDRFFATVFLGSGLLFVAMLFVACAEAGGLIHAATHQESMQQPEALLVNARISALLLNVYAMRMAAVFTISVATIALRTHIIAKWLAFAGYASAVVLLIGVGITPWVQLLFPLWILLLSIDILRRSWRPATHEQDPASRSTLA
jgi:hypothetical protein